MKIPSTTRTCPVFLCLIFLTYTAAFATIPANDYNPIHVENPILVERTLYDDFLDRTPIMTIAIDGSIDVDTLIVLKAIHKIQQKTHEELKEEVAELGKKHELKYSMNLNQI